MIHRLLMLSIIMLAGLAGTAPAFGQSAERSHNAPTATVKVTLSGVNETVHIVQTEDGAIRFVLYPRGGQPQFLTPIDFARRVHDEQTRRSWILALLNVTDLGGVAWVLLGLVGQVLFAGRLIVQWLASERSKASVVPPAFWWMALGGASLLLVYFIWRRDIVGILGQCTGWIIYTRNLYFIYLKHRDQPIIDTEVETVE